MKRSGLSMAAMVATVVMVLTVSTYQFTNRLRIIAEYANLKIDFLKMAFLE